MSEEIKNSDRRRPFIAASARSEEIDGSLGQENFPPETSRIEDELPVLTEIISIGQPAAQQDPTEINAVVNKIAQMVSAKLLAEFPALLDAALDRNIQANRNRQKKS